MQNQTNGIMQGLTEEMLFRGLSASAENVYIFKSDVKNGYSVWSDNAVEYFGLPEGYETDVTNIWIEHVHPDDRPGYCKDLEKLFSGEHNRHYYQYRAKNAKGEYVWLECVGCITYSPENHNPFFVGIITRLDITNKYDPITNCLTFSEFYKAKIDQPSSIFLLGFDQFRKVVNSIGYAQSDKILSLLGAILHKNFGQNSVYRMTGDEFLVLLSMHSQEELEFIFKSLQKEFKALCSESDYQVNLGFSCGATTYMPAFESKEDVIKHLEHSLEYSKQLGRETFTMFSSVIEEKHLRATKIKFLLTQAINNHFEGFSVFYQPIINSQTHEIHAVEALLRFNDIKMGNISPIEFIPLLEESNEICEVGLWVAKKVLQQKAAWEKIHPGLKVGINVSLKQLQNRTLVDNILNMIDEYHIKPDEVAIELTESCKMTDPASMIEILMPLQKKGVYIYLDDFGMEQSSFTLVQQLPISGVKIDHSFVRVMVGTGDERKDRANIAIVSSIYYMCQQLNLRVVCEGLETEEIDKLICKMGIQFLQGYYYTFPLPANVIEQKWL